MLLNKVFYDINLKLLVNYQLRLSIYDSLIVSSSFLYWYRLNVFWILKIMTWISQIFQFPWIHTKNHATYMAFGGFVETWSSSAPLVNRCHFRNLRLHVCCYSLLKIKPHSFYNVTCSPNRETDSILPDSLCTWIQDYDWVPQ